MALLITLVCYHAARGQYPTCLVYTLQPQLDF